MSEYLYSFFSCFLYIDTHHNSISSQNVMKLKKTDINLASHISLLFGKIQYINYILRFVSPPKLQFWLRSWRGRCWWMVHGRVLMDKFCWGRRWWGWRKIEILWNGKHILTHHVWAYCILSKLKRFYVVFYFYF